MAKRAKLHRILTDAMNVHRQRLAPDDPTEAQNRAQAAGTKILEVRNGKGSYDDLKPGSDLASDVEAMLADLKRLEPIAA